MNSYYYNILIDGEIIATGGEFLTEEVVVFNTEGNVMASNSDQSSINNIDGDNAYSWTPSGLAVTDSLRFRIVSSDGKARDINGWYIKIRNPVGTAAPKFKTVRPKLVKR